MLIINIANCGGIMKYKEILYEVEGGLAEITLNNPEIMNAMSEAMMQEWVDALEKSEQDKSVKVVMVTGKGRAFCAGGNVKNIEGSTRPEGRRPGGPRSGPFGGIITASKNLKKPYIAAVNGAAIGGGMDMVSLTDIRLASESARFGTGYIRMANIPALGGFFLLPRLVGVGNALDLLWTGRLMGSEEALKMGYVQAIYSDSEFIEKAREFCLNLAKGPSVAINFTKQMVYDALELESLDKAMPMVDTIIPLIQKTEDAKEGPRAFLERRSPNFKGK
jgi:enoyl-CoA hydratase/carnithine racemase